MKLTDILLFLLLSAIWGGSFIFMRILSPVLGPVSTTGLRLFIAGAFLVVVFLFTKFRLDWRKNIVHFLVIGVINSAVPFTLLSFAALHQSAAVSAILNSIAPIWGAVFSIFMIKERLTLTKAAGMLLGGAGVAVISLFGKTTHMEISAVGVLSVVLATICYGFGSTYAKKYAHAIPPKAVAAGSQFIAGVLFIPYMAVEPPKAILRPEIAVLALAFALLSSALAYLIYYRLLVSVGPTRSLAVTLVVPVFGFLWGRIFLHERITWPMLVGGAIIFAGLFLINRNPGRAGEGSVERHGRFAIILVENVHRALSGERALKGCGIPYKLIPVPRSVSSSCGVCLRIDSADTDGAARCMRDNMCKYERIIDIEG